MKYLLLILFAILLMSACKGTKKLSENIPSAPNSIESLRMRLIAHNLDFDTYAGSGNAELVDPDLNINASFSYRIKKDSLIWLSASKFGFEALRALIRPDSAFVLNRLEQTLYKGAIEELPISFGFEMLQDYLTAQNFYNSEDALSLTEEENAFILSNNYEGADKRIYQIEMGSKLLSGILIPAYPFMDDMYRLELNYTNYQLHDDEFQIPVLRNLMMNGSDGTIRSLSLELNKININKELKFPFSINPRYRIETF